MAAQAILRGIAPPAVETARVLELGCGDGANLVPMAFGLPEATFLGIDRNAAALARGRELATALGLTNIELREGDLEHLEPPGSFDYVVAHGVYSWVAPPARERLLAIAGGALTRDGLLYLSYNTKPGGHLRQIVRDLMQFGAREATDAREVVARARDAVRLVAGAQRPGDAYGAFLDEYLSRVPERDDARLFHDDLETWNDPVYLTEVVAHAAGHGLRFLAEAELHESSMGDLPAETADALDALEPRTEVEQEQALDFLRLRVHRQTLFTLGGAEPPSVPGPRRVEALHAYSPLRASDPRADLEDESLVAFEDGQGARLSTDHPAVKRALATLADAWPGPVRVAYLTAASDDPDTLRQAILGGHAAGIVELTTHAPRMASAPGDRPRASRLARVQAAGGADELTNLKHERIAIADEVDRALIALLDGTRERAALTRAMRGTNAARHLAASLARLAELGLLVASDRSSA
jgi:SAM-dependent methyltransferase